MAHARSIGANLILWSTLLPQLWRIHFLCTKALCMSCGLYFFLQETGLQFPIVSVWILDCLSKQTVIARAFTQQLEQLEVEVSVKVVLLSFFNLNSRVWMHTVQLLYSIQLMWVLCHRYWYLRIMKASDCLK